MGRPDHQTPPVITTVVVELYDTPAVPTCGVRLTDEHHLDRHSILWLSHLGYPHDPKLWVNLVHTDAWVPEHNPSTAFMGDLLAGEAPTYP